MGRANSLENILMLGKIDSWSGGCAWQKTGLLHIIIDVMDMSLSKLGEMVMDRDA